MDLTHTRPDARPSNPEDRPPPPPDPNGEIPAWAPDRWPDVLLDPQELEDEDEE